MLFEKLQEFRTANKPVAFCRWADGAGLLVGYVLDVSREEARFALIDTLGLPDEESVVPLASICRLEESVEYIECLRLFSRITPPVEEAKGQATRSAKVIRHRLRKAASSGECVHLTLLGDEGLHYKVLRTDREWFELAEYVDNPLLPTDHLLIRLDQISKMRWRSTSELAMTAVWKCTHFE